MTQVRTNLVISAQAQGFDQIQQRLSALTRAAAEAAERQARGFAGAQADLTSFKRIGERTFKEFQGGVDSLSTAGFQREVEGLQQRLKELAKEQLATIRTMEDLDKGTEAYRQLGIYLREIDEDTGRVNRSLTALTRAFSDQARAAADAQQASGAFLQGMLQGALPESYIMRGPGAIRQAAGVATGKMARGVAGGVASTPFTGAAGLTQAVGSIPVIGGMIAGQLQASLGMVSQGLGAQAARRSLISMLGGADGVAGARAAAMSRFEGSYGGAGQTAADRALLAERGRGGPGDPGYDLMREEALRRQKGRAEAGGAAAGRARSSAMGGIRKAGIDLLGVGEVEALQQAGAIMQASGGTRADLGDMLRPGFAAMTRYGVGAETVGAFGRAGRAGEGGLAGVGVGGGAQAMEDAIANAMELGLRGSDLAKYMEQMAEGINQWQQTGMPINPASIGAMGRVLSTSGFGGTRGATIARGLQSAGQRVSERGVSSAADMLILQTMGGFQGGGAAEYEQALMRLEAGGDGAGAGMESMLDRLRTAGGGGATGRLTMRRALGQMGVSVSATEIERYERMRAGGELTEAERESAVGFEQRVAEGMQAAPGGFRSMEQEAQQAISNWAGSLRAYNSVQNRQIDIGERMAPVMINLEKSTTATANAFSTLAVGPLTTFTNQIISITTKLESLANTLIAVQQNRGIAGRLSDIITGG